FRRIWPPIHPSSSQFAIAPALLRDTIAEVLVSKGTHSEADFILVSRKMQIDEMGFLLFGEMQDKLTYFPKQTDAQLADQKGFIVIYLESPCSGTCWDVSSKSALTHNGGGDSNSIANMVTYALNQYKGDSTKVFVTESSSGAMMTNVMAATYPEMFAAGIVYSGVPAGCFVSSSGGVDAWNNTCAQDQARATSAAWAQVVKDMYPGCNGTRPKMQIYHGSADGTLLPNN
ncbi:putative Carbohydrate esterase family 1 protein, partial [Seiridium cardinale]